MYTYWGGTRCTSTTCPMTLPGGFKFLCLVFKTFQHLFESTCAISEQKLTLSENINRMPPAIAAHIVLAQLCSCLSRIFKIHERGASNDQQIRSNDIHRSELCAGDSSLDDICAELRADKFGFRYAANAQCRRIDGDHRPESQECVGTCARRSDSMVGEQ